ncbi:MAG TPA: serine O-acetyltransferase [Pseudomonas sp.]|nr:serine O-acetyltransferase [Pseudomonas sp.]
MSNLSVSDLWSELRAQAQRALDTEPTLATIVRQTILDQPDFGGALAHRIGHALADSIEQSHTLTDRFAGLHHQLPALAETACCDLQAIVSRDPAFDSALEVFLFSKGFLALQAYRIGHQLHGRGERLLAMFIQARCNERLGIDINPASRIGSGIMLDHGTGIVIGETAVVGDDVSILQGVTLGGTGKEGGDRHPKVRSGVMIGAGAKILGNIEIGEGAKVGAGSIVLHPVAPHTTVVGNPAHQVGKPRHARPALDMDQSFDGDS